MRASVLGALLVIGLCAGCHNGTSAKDEEPPTRLFAPAEMRIHPIFTQVRDWTGDGVPDGIEVLIEFRDGFGDLTKAAGIALFELYDYRPHHSDPRGRRVANPWVGSLRTAAEQRQHWSGIPRTYTFRLEYEQVRSNRSYVLAASFDPVDGERFFHEIVLEARQPQEEAPHGPSATAPAAR
jgi:hypothetical protein